MHKVILCPRYRQLEFAIKESILELDKATGLLVPVRYIPSPHCDDRPDNGVIDMIVIHNISLPPGQFGTDAIAAFFSGKLDESQDPYFPSISHLKVSSHLLIHRTGKMTQFVPFTKRAWHAGQSYFQGREKCNDFSIGIELEGTDTLPFEDKQYDTLNQVITLLLKKYPEITRQKVVGHSDIAPGRKTDPGPAFEWDRIR